MFDKLKQLQRLGKLRKLGKELAEVKVSIEEGGVRVVVGGDLRLWELEIEGVEKEQSEKIKKVINKGLGKVQKRLARRSQEALVELLR